MGYFEDGYMAHIRNLVDSGVTYSLDVRNAVHMNASK